MQFLERKRPKESPLCHIDGHVSPEECRITTKARRKLWCIRDTHRTRIVSLEDDCCESNRCHHEITRMRWTSCPVFVFFLHTLEDWSSIGHKKFHKRPNLPQSARPTCWKSRSTSCVSGVSGRTGKFQP